MTELTGQRVLIFGTGAMGRAVAREAIARGAHVTVAGRERGRLDSVAADVDGVLTVMADPESAEDVERVMGGALDHVAALMGTSGAVASSMVDTPVHDAQRAFGRLWGSYNILRSAAGHVSRRGSVTVLSGSSSRRPVAGLAVWGALHGAIESLARSAVLELAPIRVNTVSPGGIGIGMDRQLTAHQGTARDIALAVVGFMENDAITGALLDVDGGERLGRFSTPDSADGPVVTP